VVRKGKKECRGPGGVLEIDRVALEQVIEGLLERIQLLILGSVSDKVVERPRAVDVGGRDISARVHYTVGWKGR
jgi:hypothetical protein